ncbi:MAG: regulatory protein RecX [Rhizobium sp.]|nr:regulatory protein RecX [Rhizobium sp.]
MGEGEAENPGDADKPTTRMLSWSKNSAAYRLARRMMSERELAGAIKRKAKSKFDGITEAQLLGLAEYAVSFGRSMMALDDENYAQVRAASAGRSGKSTRAVARKLAEKGIDRDIIETAVGEIDDLHSAVVYARKKAFGPFRRKSSDEQQERRELASFGRQGFSFDIGRRLTRMTLEEAQEILSAPSTVTDQA